MGHEQMLEGTGGEYTLSIYEKALPSFLCAEEKLCLARECGFDAFELSVDESEEKQQRLDWPDGVSIRLSELAMQKGIPVQSICLSALRKYPLGSHDRTVRRRGAEVVRKTIDLAGMLGARVIQLAGYDVYYENSDEDTRLYFLDGLADAAGYASNKGVILALETMETQFMDTVGKAIECISRIDSPYLQLYPDVGNLCNAYFKYGMRAEDDIIKGAGHIVAAHLKETKPGKYRDMALGTGQTDYITTIRALWRQGVRRYTAEYWYLGEKDWRERLKSASAFLRKKIETAAEECQ